MPIPFLIGAVVVASGALAAGGHINAKETNEKAQSKIKKAEKKYEKAIKASEEYKVLTEHALLNLAHTKKQILETSFKKFIKEYNKIKHLEVRKTKGLNEIENFRLEENDLVALQELSDIYDKTFSSGLKGTAAGTAIALVAVGPTAVLGAATSAVGALSALGSIGFASVASIGGIATGVGAMGAALGASLASPLALIAAPALLFTAFSADKEADKNYEKAKVYAAEVDVAIEKIQLNNILCDGLVKKSEMSHNLLIELNNLFVHLVVSLSRITKKHHRGFSNFFGLFSRKKSHEYTEDELELIAVTRSLAGAIKSVLDTPLLTQNGKLNSGIDNVCRQAGGSLPSFRSSAQQLALAR